MAGKLKRLLCLFMSIVFILSMVYIPPVSAEENNTLTLNITPAEALAGATIILQNSETGAECQAEADGTTYLLDSGKYTYIVRSPLYVTKMGTVEVAGDVTLDIAMEPTPAGELFLNKIGDDHQNGTNNNSAGRDMEVEGSGYVGWLRSVAWIKFKDVNLLGGIESYTLNYARQGNDNMAFEVRVAPSGSSFDDAVTIGTLDFNTPSGGWGSPGLNITCDDISAHSGGVQDVYLVFTKGEYNFGGVTFQLSPLPEEPPSFDTTFSVRPYDAAITVETLSGEPCSPTEEGGKTYNLEEGFYRYTVSKEGYETQSYILPVSASKRIMTVLLPEGADEYTRYEAEGAVIQGGNIITNPSSSGGEKVGGFTTTTTLGSINSTFSNISNVKFTVERETTGIVEVIICYDSSVAADNQDRIAVKCNDGTVKEVYLNSTGKSSVFVDMRAGENTIYVSNVLSPRISSGGNAWVDLDYIDVNTVTVPGSIEPGEGDEPYVQPGNPIITSIFTADSEAHVWPDNPNKLYVYASHDNYPSNGCDLMDAYHVYSTENMVDWVDEGEILRASDLDWQGGADRPFMWAPDAAYRDGYYYFYWPTPTNTSGGNWGSTWQTGVRRSRYPDRGFEEIPAEETYTEDYKGYIEGAGGDGMIDVCVRVYDDQAYIYIGGSQRFYQGKLKDDMVTLDGPLERVSSSVVPNYHEGPSVFERDGLYYLIYPGGSDSSTGYSGDCFNYCTSDNPLGPWEYKGVFFNPTNCDTSHGSIVEFNGKWYLFYHTQDLSNNGTLRSVCVDEVLFNEDGTIQRFTKTLNGVEQNGPDYVRSEGGIYGADDAEISGGAVKTKDSSAGNDGKVITDLYISGATVEFKNVDGGKGGRAMIVFHYSTPDDLPKMTLSVNGYNYKNINFVKTGGRSFFTESTFTVKKLEPGTNNTIKLVSPTNGSGKLNLNYIEVILLDEENDKDILSVASIEGISVDYGTEIGDIELPASVQVKLDGGLTMELDVTWDTSSYNPNQAGTYKLSGTLTLPDDGSIVNTWDLKASATVTVKPQTIISRVFVQDDGNGTASASPVTATEGTEITLTATANYGYHFKEWQVISGGVTITDNKFTMPANDVMVKAVFEEDEYDVTVENDGNGTAYASAAAATEGTVITLIAIAKDGCHFKEWQAVSGDVTITDNKFTMPAKDVTVKAIFAKDEYNVTVGNDGNGTASASAVKATEGTEITLTATANTGYQFKEWQVGSGGVTITANKFTMPARNVTIKAIFEKVTYTVTFNTNGGSTVASQNVKHGESTAKPTDPTRDGYTFAGWYSDTELKNVYGFNTVVTSDITLYAKWTANAVFKTHKGYMQGYSDGSFNPGGNLKRAEAVMILYRLIEDENKDDAQVTSNFADVTNKNAWYYHAVAYMEEAGLISGYTDNTFKPEDTIKRAEFVTLAAKFMKLDISKSGTTVFPDVSLDYWGYNAITRAADEGWVKGDDSGNFRPESKITRAEAVTVINRMLGRGVPTKNIPADCSKIFTDVSDSTVWYYSAVIEAATNHTFTRDADGNEIWSSWGVYRAN